MAWIKFGGWAQNRYCKNIGKFEFGGLVRDVHIRIYVSRKFWWIFNLAVVIQTASPPNLIPRQIFRLYGILKILYYSILSRKLNIMIPDALYKHSVFLGADNITMGEFCFQSYSCWGSWYQSLRQWNDVQSQTRCRFTQIWHTFMVFE